MAASETDQYDNITKKLPDVGPHFDRLVNDAIKDVALNWSGPRNDKLFARKLSKYFGMRQAEYWADTTLKTQGYYNPETSAFIDVNISDSRLIGMGQMATTLNLHQHYFGADKITHFFGVGNLYFSDYLKYKSKKIPFKKSIAEILLDGQYTEKMLWGSLSTGVFSNADLIANFEGFRFIYNLFYPDFINGSRPYIRWQGNVPSIDKWFSFKYYTSDLWNEAIVSGHFNCAIQKKILPKLVQKCENPLYYKSALSLALDLKSPLVKRYQSFGLPIKTDFSIANICLHKELIKQSGFNYCHEPSRDDLDDPIRSFNAFYRVMKEENKSSLKIVDEAFDAKVAQIYQQIQGQNNSQQQLSLYEYSPIGCNELIQKADNEHEQIIQVYQKHREIFETIHSLLTQQKSLLALSYLAKIFLPYSKVIHYPKISLYGKTQLQQSCVEINAIWTSNRSVSFRENTQVNLYACYEINHQNKSIKLKSGYKFKDPYLEVNSLAGYYSLWHRDGYIFRTIPKLCNSFLIMKPNQKMRREVSSILQRYLSK